MLLLTVKSRHSPSCPAGTPGWPRQRDQKPAGQCPLLGGHCFSWHLLRCIWPLITDIAPRFLGCRPDDFGHPTSWSTAAKVVIAGATFGVTQGEHSNTLVRTVSGVDQAAAPIFNRFWSFRSSCETVDPARMHAGIKTRPRAGVVPGHAVRDSEVQRTSFVETETLRARAA